jgi:hypothetical protein
MRPSSRPCSCSRRRPRRGDVHHLQHFLDPGGPAHPRLGSPAGTRRIARPGAALGHRRGGGRGPAGLGGRHRRRHGPGVGPACPHRHHRPDHSGLPLVLDASTVAIALTVAVVVMLVASLAPAVRASRIAPLAALRDVAVDRSATSRRRAVAGAVVIGAGSALTIVGATGEALLPTGLGALATLIGVVARTCPTRPVPPTSTC